MPPDAPHRTGDEPDPELDPRFTFANERTFLAWNRTALALIAAGLAAEQLLEVEGRGFVLALVVPLIGLGTFLALASHRRWRQSERAMRADQPLPPSNLPRILAAGVVTIAVAALVLVVHSLS